jgi:hypothetical protein
VRSHCMKRRMRWFPSAMSATYLAGAEGGCFHSGVRRLTTNMTVMISTKYIIWTTRYSISYIRRAFYCSTELFCQRMRTAMGDKIGVNYGRLSSWPMPHTQAIEKIRSLGANAIKLFDSDRGTLDALVNSGLRVTVAIPNGELAEYANSRRACDEYAAMLRSYLNRNVLIDTVAVGNEATASWHGGRYSALLMPVFLGLRAAFEAVGVAERIKLTTPFDMSILEVSYPPSAGRLRPNCEGVVKDVLYFLRNNGGSFMINVYPPITLHENPSIETPFATGERGAGGYDDAGRHYDNLFDAQIDAVYAAIERVGYATDDFIIGEVGWATAGGHCFHRRNAEAFLRSFLERRRRGTPRIRKPIPAFQFAFIDEDMKDTVGGRAEYERSWGLFDANDEKKYGDLRLS